MVIIKMLRRITGFNQDELADYLEVSRASINSWENSNGEMSTYQKNIISNKFNIPISLLDDDINTDIEKCKLLYSFINSRWNEINVNNTIDNEDDFLNKIEFEMKKDEKREVLSDYEIIDALSNAYDPYTGEVFNEDHILNDTKIKEFLNEIKNKYYKYGTNITKDMLKGNQIVLFEELRKWRMDMTAQEGFFSAYMVFTDKELINIITSTINKKEDLLNIKGIGKIKYEKYGDDLFRILQEGKYDFHINLKD